MRLTILLSSLLILSDFPLSASVIIALSPLTHTVSPGSTATVQVGISGLGLNAAPSLGAYDLNIAFDPTVLSFTGLTFGDSVKGDQLDLSGAGTIADFSSPSAGVLEFFEISLDPADVLDAQQSDRFTLATLTFKAIGAGDGALVPAINSIGDSEGTAISAGLQSGGIDVVATPEPSTFVLFVPVAVLVGWRGFRLRSRA